ncbi:MAG TPA: HNH endonuclease [Candidatus Saccharimonadales bacterium]
MSSKKEIRRKFREVCLKRDKLTCVMCGLKAKSFEDAEKLFDVHHITDRKIMPSGGYVLENGITLCNEDHIKAEVFHSTGIPAEGYSIEDLYKKINSNYELAVEASNKLDS